MNTTTPFTATTLTLHDAYMQWLDLPHPSKPELLNKDRGTTDLLNYQRALRCFAVGASNGVDNLELVPASTLEVNESLLVRQVVKGAELLAARSNNSTPSEKTLKNLIACCKAVQTTCMADRPGDFQPKSPAKMRKERPKRKSRPRFARERWPEPLKQDWQGYFSWKTKDILRPEEGERLRKKTCRPISLEAHARRINPLVGYLVKERKLRDFDLTTVCNLDYYIDFLNWYLNQEADGGYNGAKDTGTTLATISQYLVAMKRMAQTGPNGKNIWDEFYAASHKPMEIGARRAELPEQREIGAWKPWDLSDIAQEAWSKSAPRYWRGDGRKRARQVLARKRSGLFFMLAYETPLRLRNFREMKWGKNLIRLPDGRWEVLFRGEELKVARRGHKTNEYRQTYSREASALIERWRDTLREAVGPEFEKKLPFVFASSDLTPSPISDPAFRQSLQGLVLELRGDEFEPHDVRRIVASYLVNEHGVGGLGLAAELLGDTIDVVLKTYYRPNNDQTMQGYLEMRNKKKP